MTTFQDGPAKGQTLMLRITPFLLRVTESNGKWDALNEKGDEALPQEKLHCYILDDYRGAAHINMGRGRGGFYPIVTYRLFSPQPGDDVMRNNTVWDAWCEQHRHLYDEWKALHNRQAE